METTLKEKLKLNIKYAIYAYISISIAFYLSAPIFLGVICSKADPFSALVSIYMYTFAIISHAVITTRLYESNKDIVKLIDGDVNYEQSF